LSYELSIGVKSEVANVLCWLSDLPGE